MCKTKKSYIITKWLYTCVYIYVCHVLTNLFSTMVNRLNQRCRIRRQKNDIQLKTSNFNNFFFAMTCGIVQNHNSNTGPTMKITNKFRRFRHKVVEGVQILPSFLVAIIAEVVTKGPNGLGSKTCSVHAA